ncbi:MAG: Fe-S cluster assembly protein SufD [Acidobacteria bacterium]|nr:Fe-S cluster assembly protein SufD [Acidobacteriota bacterium]MCW5968890.1 Fe-S cluster assembly protein SufD [Blastocatellales bacterium]
MTPIAAKEKNDFLPAVRLFAKTRGEGDPAWFAGLRQLAAARAEELELPTTRDEEWKYTNIAPILKTPFRQVFDLQLNGLREKDLTPYLIDETRGSRLVFVNGLYSPELSDASNVSAGVAIGNLGAIPETLSGQLHKHLGAYADYGKQAFTALNTAMLGDGAYVHIRAGQVIEQPIHLLFVSSAAEAATVSHPRVLLIAERGSMATVIESYFAAGENRYFTNAVTEVFAAEGASIEHYRLQEESDRAFHIGTTHVHQERESIYRSCAISIGAELSRHALNVALTDEFTETVIDGLYVVAGRQHVDNHTVLDHRKPHGTSRQLYKGILDDSARAVFNGAVFVREGALLTDSRQLNKNLLLSSESRVDTKPQLEIFADDVKCAHGATVGQLESDELFYLASRGIGAEQARALLTYGFAEDVISKIRLRSVRRQLDRMVLEKLHQNLEVN